MDDREIALEILKLYVDRTKKSFTLEEVIDAYLFILEEIGGGSKKEDREEHGDQSDDSLFDFKEPISLSDKNV